MFPPCTILIDAFDLNVEDGGVGFGDLGYRSPLSSSHGRILAMSKASRLLSEYPCALAT